MRTALGMVVLMTSVMVIAGCSSVQPDDRSSAPTTAFGGEATTPVKGEAAWTGDIACLGPARSLEILPAPGGAASPEAERNAFVSASAEGLPKDGYLLAADTPPTSSGEPGQRVYVHPTSDGHIDVRLAVVHLEGGWRVDSVQTCLG
jgi:hypothetical protein